MNCVRKDHGHALRKHACEHKCKRKYELYSSEILCDKFPLLEREAPVSPLRPECVETARDIPL
jgi:hypothetical protein